VVQYLREQGADMEEMNDFGRTPLQEAALHGYIPVVQYQCEPVADTEATGGGGGTSLHFAATLVTSLWCSTCVNRGLSNRTRYLKAPPLSFRNECVHIVSE